MRRAGDPPNLQPCAVAFAEMQHNETLNATHAGA
jgi:hypothetical protein